MCTVTKCSLHLTPIPGAALRCLGGRAGTALLGCIRASSQGRVFPLLQPNAASLGPAGADWVLGKRQGEALALLTSVAEFPLVLVPLIFLSILPQSCFYA